MAKIKISQLTAKGTNLAGTDLLPIAESAGGGSYVTKRVTGTEVGAGGSVTLTIGSTDIASGTIGRVLFQGASNKLQQSANFFWDDTNSALGLGASPLSTSRLDIRAKDGLSTSQSFRIQSNTGSITQFEVNGQGLTSIRTQGGGAATSFSVNLQGGNEVFRVQENNIIRFRQVYTFAENLGLNFFGGNDINNSIQFGYLTAVNLIGTSRNHVAYVGTVNLTNGTNTFNGLNINHSITGTGGTPTNTLNLININPTINITNGTSTLRGLYYNPTLTSTTGVTHRAIETTTGNVIFNSTSGNIAIGGMSFGTSSDKVLAQYNGTAPSSSPTDAFQMYSADIVGGNAAPHFRTENGDIVKIYQETTGVASAVFVQNAGTRVDEVSTFDGYTIAQVVKALRNLGILA